MGIHSIIEAWDLIEGGVYPPVPSWLQHRLEIDITHYLMETYCSVPQDNCKVLALHFLLVFWFISYS